MKKGTTIGIPRFIEAVRKKYGIASDYVLAKKLKVSQPEANWFRRGKKVPNTAVCIRIANLLKKNPVELLLVAQRDRASPEEKEHWEMALSAVDVLINVPQHPRYIPQKVEDIGHDLRQLESQMLSYEGNIAYTEMDGILRSTESSVDSLMERWKVWKRDGPLFPNYLMGNQFAIKRGVKIRRLFIFQKDQLTQEEEMAEALQVLSDQKLVGVSLFFAFREELAPTLTFQRLAAEYKKQGVTGLINTALFDNEILLFSRSYGEHSLGDDGTTPPITMIDQLHISWNEDHLRNLNPGSLFETRYVTEYKGERSLRAGLSRSRKVTR